MVLVIAVRDSGPEIIPKAKLQIMFGGVYYGENEHHRAHNFLVLAEISQQFCMLFCIRDSHQIKE